MTSTPTAAAAKRTSATYTINQHKHLYAAWAACRGASVVGCRFTVEQGRELLEACGFVPALSVPKYLPNLKSIDDQHLRWRVAMIKAARNSGLSMTHGVAAKLINLYLKCRFVCGGHHDHPRVRQLHPPIDSVMLKALIQHNVGGFASQWRQLQNQRWSKFSSAQYQHAISLIRQSLNGEPLWKIEEYWQGNQ
jgi:hypothetical protein